MEFANAFARAYWEVPPVTRTYITASFLTTLALQMEFISPFQLYFNPKLIFNQHQYWRLITAFLFFGQLGFHCLFNMAFTYRYCRMLEEEFYRNRTADFFYLFLVGGSLMNILAYFVNLLFLGQAFAIMLVYIWSRRNPAIRMNFFGLLSFQAPYLPWVLLGFSILLGSSTAVDMIGIVVGHFYYFFEDVFPNEPHGFRVLETPRFIKMSFQALGIDEQPFPEEERPEQFDFTNQPPPQQHQARPEYSQQADRSSSTQTDSNPRGAGTEDVQEEEDTVTRPSASSSHETSELNTNDNTNKKTENQSELRARNVGANISSNSENS